MKADEWWLDITNNRNPDLKVGDPDKPYMLRWYIVPRNPIANVYLHHFLRDDDDRALHDHPWDSQSVLLSGKLREHMPEGSRIITPGMVINRKAEDCHRLEVLERGFTLFTTGPRVRDWGFHCPQGWVHWEDFVSPENVGEVGRGCGEYQPKDTNND